MLLFLFFFRVFWRILWFIFLLASFASWRFNVLLIRVHSCNSWFHCIGICGFLPTALNDQHGVAETEKTVLLLHGGLVGVQNIDAACKTR